MTTPLWAMSPETSREQEQLTAEAVENQKEEQWQDNLIKEAQKWINSSKEASERSAEWVKEDVQRMGDFEYKIMRINSKDDETIVQELNLLGAQRWEVYWVKERRRRNSIFPKNEQFELI